MKTKFLSKIIFGLLLTVSILFFTSCDALKQTLNLNSGGGWFYSTDESTDGIKELTYTFKAGDTLGDVLDSNGFPGYSVFTNTTLGIKYSYEENGIYYRQSGFKLLNEEGELVKYYYSDDILTESIDLETDYSRYYKATFNLNGGNFNGSASDVERWIPDYFYFTDEEWAVEPTKTGYTFDGWTETKNGSTKIDYMPSKNVTLYAKWVAE